MAMVWKALRYSEAMVYEAWRSRAKLQGEVEVDATTLRSWLLQRGGGTKPKRHCQAWAAVSDSQEVSLWLLPLVHTAAKAVGPPESWPRMKAAGAMNAVAQATGEFLLPARNSLPLHQYTCNKGQLVSAGVGQSLLGLRVGRRLQAWGTTVLTYSCPPGVHRHCGWRRGLQRVRGGGGPGNATVSMQS